MPEWVNAFPDWVKNSWFVYVTFHDLVQWSVMVVLAKTAWGHRQKKKEWEKLIEHIHNELHEHIEEDSSFHGDLGQTGMTKGK